MSLLDYILKNLFLHDNLASLLPHLFQPLMISTTPNSTLPHHHHSFTPTLLCVPHLGKKKGSTTTLSPIKAPSLLPDLTLITGSF